MVPSSEMKFGAEELERSLSQILGVVSFLEMKSWPPSEERVTRLLKERRGGV